MIFSSLAATTAFFQTFIPAAVIWVALYLTAISLRRDSSAAFSKKSLRVGVSVLGFFVCFVIALFIRSYFDPTSHQPVGVSPLVQAVMLYYWLDPSLEGKEDDSLEWVLGLVFIVSVLSASVLSNTHSGIRQSGQVELAQINQNENSNSVGSAVNRPIDPSCRTEMVKGLEVINCES